MNVLRKNNYTYAHNPFLVYLTLLPNYALHLRNLLNIVQGLWMSTTSKQDLLIDVMHLYFFSLVLCKWR